MALELELPVELEREVFAVASGEGQDLNGYVHTLLIDALESEKQKVYQLVEQVLETPPTLLAADPYSWEEVHAYGVHKMRLLCAARGLNYDTLSDEELEILVGDIADE